MASKITPANLRVTVTETISLNGNALGGTNTLNLSGITNVNKCIVDCLHSAETALVGFVGGIEGDLAKSYAAGQFDQDNVKYFRITNLDDANYVLLTFRNSGSTNAAETAIKLDAGCTFIYGVGITGAVVGTERTMTSLNAAISVATDTNLNNLIDVVGIANTATVNLEIFVASI